MYPVVPAINLKENIDNLQDCIRIESCPVKDKNIEDHLDDAGRPAPEILFDGEPYTQKAENGGD